VYEPEYRLLTSAAGLLVGTGLFLFGKVAAEHGSYYATAALHGLLMSGIMATVVSTSSYILDAYREMGSEIFIIGMVLKNFLFFAFSYFINDWLARAGIKEVIIPSEPQHLRSWRRCLSCTCLANAIADFGLVTIWSGK
jgi:hypothetical protein